MSLVIRPFDSKDSTAELTELLHRAYAENAALGLHFVASHQSEETTKNRLARGPALIAELDGKIVGTVTVGFPVVFDDGEYLPQGTLASFGQFAVDPSAQRQGVGLSLLRAAEQAALEIGADEMCLDTAESAHHLIRYYEKHGYQIVGHADWRPEVNYKSVIMAKRLISLPEHA